MHCAIAKKLRPAHSACGAAGGNGGNGNGAGVGVGAAAETAAAAATAGVAAAAMGAFTVFFGLAGAAMPTGLTDAAGAASGVDVIATAEAVEGSTGPVAAGMVAGDAKAIGAAGVALRPANQYQPAPASSETKSTATPIPRPFDDLGSGNVKTASG